MTASGAGSKETWILRVLLLRVYVVLYWLDAFSCRLALLGIYLLIFIFGGTVSPSTRHLVEFCIGAASRQSV